VRSAFLLRLLLDFADFDFRSSLAERRRGLFASVSASKARIPRFVVHPPTHPYLDLKAFLDLEAILDESDDERGRVLKTATGERKSSSCRSRY
jgi:hypothetical protein